MDFVNQWCINICATLVIAVIFSILTPKGNMGKYLKIIIALFITVSFLLPITDIKDSDFSFSEIKGFADEDAFESNTYEGLVEAQIKNMLKEHNINNALVSCSLMMNNNEIEVKSIVVSITDEYNDEEVKNMIFDNLGYLVQVKYIGQ